MTVPAPAPGNRSHRVRRAALAVALGGGLALGVAGLAYADDASTAPSAPVATPSGAIPSGAIPSGPTPPGAPPSGAAPAGPPAAGAEAAKVKHRPHLDGTVRKIGSGKIMIIDREGFTRQINIASVPDGVVVGTQVHAEGAVNADGVSLDAASVVVAPERGPGGPKGPGKGGPAGGPREGRQPPAPAGAGGPAGPGPGESGTPAAPAPVPSGSTAAPAPSATN